jgi:hypothetical protein
MQSELRVKTGSLKLTIVLGFFASVVIIALALLYHVEFSAILFGVAWSVVTLGTIASIAAFYRLAHRRELNRLELEERRAKLRIVQLEADHKALEAVVLAIPASQRIITLPDSPLRLIEALPGAGYKVLADQTLVTSAVDLLAALDNFQRVLIVGASDSGKTTLLQWLVARRLPVSKVVIIDPHGWPGKWPAGAMIIGTGRAYADIDRALTALVQLMGNRYDQIGRGEVAEMGHDKMTILIDEWRAITANLGRPAGDAIKALLTESRKAAFSVFVASHSDRAKPLGLEGEYDLKDGFAVVRLAVVNGQRLATLDTGSGETPAALPGPYRPAPQVAADVGYPGALTAADLTDPQPTPAEAFILKLHQEGKSLNEISRQLWGSSGGYQVNQIKSILTKFSV